MILDLIVEHKLSVIHSSLEEPEVKQVWHVISPYINDKQPRISATNESLEKAIIEVASQLG